MRAFIGPRVFRRALDAGLKALRYMHAVSRCYYLCYRRGHCD